VQCFTARPNPRYIEHSREALVGQRILGLALSCEHLNHHG
jgi:hypothetical protein